MKTIEIIGYNRANLGKNESRKLRNDGNVPCVVYGGKKQIHFHSPMILFRELVYSPGANFIELNIVRQNIINFYNVEIVCKKYNIPYAFMQGISSIQDSFFKHLNEFIKV